MTREDIEDSVRHGEPIGERVRHGDGRMHGFGDVCHTTHQPRARL